MKTIELNDPRTGKTVRLSHAQLDQDCGVCGENMRGRYIVSVGDGSPWACNAHLGRLLQDLPDADSAGQPNPRTKNEVVYKNGNFYSQDLTRACAAADREGMVVLRIADAGMGYVVVSSVGAEQLFEEVEDG